MKAFMTDATLTIILNSVPQIIGALFAGAAACLSAMALKKGKENGDKVDAAALKTDQTHSTVADNLPGLTATVEKHGLMLQKLEKDSRGMTDKISANTVIVQGIRDRQHDIARYFQQIGLAFELKKLPDPKSFPGGGD